MTARIKMNNIAFTNTSPLNTPVIIITRQNEKDENQR